MAVTRAEAWSGEPVLYVTDNWVVDVWITKRAPKPRLARLAIRILGRIA